MKKFLDKVKGFFGATVIKKGMGYSQGPTEVAVKNLSDNSAELRTMMSSYKYDKDRDILVIPNNYEAHIPLVVGPIIRMNCKRPAIIKTGFAHSSKA